MIIIHDIPNLLPELAQILCKSKKILLVLVKYEEVEFLLYNMVSVRYLKWVGNYSPPDVVQTAVPISSGPNNEWRGIMGVEVH